MSSDSPTRPPAPAHPRPLAERMAASLRAEFGPDEPPPAAAHPKVQRIVRLWQSLRPGPGLLPGRRHFDPLQAPDLLNNIWLMEVVDEDPRRYRLRLVGGALVEAGTGIRKGQFFGDVGSREEAASAAQVFRHLERCRRINWRRGPSALGYMEHVRELERVILPMAADGVTVDIFMCLTVFYYADGREV
ncbi:PAS domain-containing protein [Desertibaculum subflavum]|uniref:PAS domain-containing protein n=1 Tax=Desertibaculum subflavum TaxID=2268458 RepID=UPI0013C4CB2A